MAQLVPVKVISSFPKVSCKASVRQKITRRRGFPKMKGEGRIIQGKDIQELYEQEYFVWNILHNISRHSEKWEILQSKNILFLQPHEKYKTIGNYFLAKTMATITPSEGLCGFLKMLIF